MYLNFDHGTELAKPISVRTAVDRGHAVITMRLFVVMVIVSAVGIGLGIVLNAWAIALAAVIASPLVAWPWWSYATPRWRDWAVGRGADPTELQRVAEREKLVWPRGHFFERTELPFRRD